MHHVGFIVHDLEKTMKRLADSQGIKPWSIYTIKPDNPIIRGKQAPSFSAKFAMALLGNTVIELISPYEGEGIYSEFLKEKGEGFHHIAFMFPSQEELDKELSAREKNGAEVLFGGGLSWPGMGVLGSYYYLDTKEMGLVIELCYAKQMPAPEKTYP
jgi:catechol 2,3-dioxygenase-like lactoylglutathione lyase family enzyme